MKQEDKCGQEEAADSISQDSLFNGQLFCAQHKDGYRFSVDAVLLAHFVVVKKNWHILDIGTGSGIISLILLHRWRESHLNITGIDVQHTLAQLASQNMKANGFQDRVDIICGDVNNISRIVAQESFDAIVCNPPFYAEGSGRTSSNTEANIARHQTTATISVFLRAAFFAVKNRGTVYFIYPAARFAELLSEAVCQKMSPKRIQFIYSYPDDSKPAQLVLMQFVKNGKPGTKVLPPLYIYDSRGGSFTKDVQGFYT